MNTSQAGGNGSHGVYFFLSYAHVPPIDRSEPAPPDHRVKDFFAKLSGRVSDLAASNSPLGAGLYDRSFDLRTDPDDALSQALGVAEVLVPLYSPLYVRPSSWSMNEHSSFERRLRGAAADPTGHIQPVLWFPLAPGESMPSDAANAVATDVPLYAELGLGALCELGQFQEHYETVVDRLAHQIVRVAEDSPIGPSAVPGTSRFSPAGQADLMIAVLAPTTADPPQWLARGVYGPRPSDWTPFSETPALPVARAAAAAAERLNLITETVDLPGSTEALQHRPVVLLIDPWILDGPGGEVLMRETLESLPTWTFPIVLSNRADPEFARRGAELHQRAIAMLPGTPPSVFAVNDAERFVNAVPTVVTRARRQFLKRLPPTGRKRPRLSDALPSSRPSPEETADHD